MAESQFSNLTIAEQEHFLSQARSLRLKRKTVSSLPILRVDRDGPLPLSFAQQRLWFLAQMEGGSEAYHMAFGVCLRGNLDRGALGRALNQIVARHEALRTTFVMVEEKPQQRIAPVKASRFHLLEHDLRQHQDAQGELKRLMAEEAGAGFDLQVGPLIRGRLIGMADEEHWLLFSMHHIVSDGWSMGVLFKELGMLYGAYRQGEEDPLPELAVQYADYALWQRKWMEGEVLREQAEYWRKNLEGAPELLELPADRVRPARQDYAGAAVELVLDAKLTAKLKELSARQGTTLYMTLLAGWAVLLGRLSGQQDVVIGTPVANRGRVEIEDLIGFFVNTLVMRVDFSGRPTVGEMLARVKRQALAAQQHQDIPFEEVVDLVQPERSLAHSPLFQVVFAWQNAATGKVELPGLEATNLQTTSNGAKFDLALSLEESEERIVGAAEYATSLYDRSTVERYLAYLRRILERIVRDDRAWIDSLPMLSDVERREILYTWNQTGAEYPQGKCLHELFEERVERTPEAVAMVEEDAALSYGELNRRANRLAHYLRSLGVKPEVRVGISSERGLEMVVALLAVLKAGGACLLLDSSYPTEAQRHRLEDSSASLLLTQAHRRERWGGLPSTLPVLDLSDSSAWNSQPERNPEHAGTGPGSGCLAYVTYTADSTGQPKGVMVTHRNVVRLVRNEEWLTPARMIEILRQNELEHLVQVYGPTETVSCTSWHELRRAEEGKRVLIGRPMANTRIYVLDAHGEPVGKGVKGELYIGGAGVARGYGNDAGVTGERFVPDPYTEETGERMYRTGDMGKWRGDGEIEFLGRNDDEAKIRGYRIELGAIEAQLKEYEGVKEAVVVVREDAPGEKGLVAYYTAPKRESLGAEVLRGHLLAKLPEYMVPAAYVCLERMPLTVNGTVDRKALPAPEGATLAVRGYEAPEGEIETMVAATWADVLEVKRIGRLDNFFSLGGRSLLAVQVIARLRQLLGVEVGISDLFARPVLSDFARGVQGGRKTRLPAITPAERVGPVPLSYAQQRLWFLAQMEGGSEAYHVPLGVRLHGRLDRAALKRALNRIVARHEALRTTLVMVDGEPVQRIAPVAEDHFHLLEHDLRQHQNAQGELDRVIAEEAEAEFDLQLGPLIRGRLIQMAEEEHALLITMHHIVSDAWSMTVLFKELSTLYDAFVRGEKDPLPELAVQYADYAVWQRKWVDGDVLTEQAEYWRKNLEGVPELLELPADRARRAQRNYAGGALPLFLDEKLTAGLKELSLREGTTLYMTLLAAWAMLLGRLSGQQDVVIGTPAANRGRVEIENLIGFFVNMLVVRVDVSGRPAVREILDRVKRQALSAQQHQDIPFEQVVELVQPVRSLAHSPVFQVTFTWLDKLEERPQLPGLESGPLELSPHVVSKFDMALLLQEAGGRIEGGLEYATALFDAKTVERYLGYFTRLLEGMVAAGEGQPVDGVMLLEEAERWQVVYEWNQTQSELPEAGCLHELFEEQVENTPEAVAVVFGEGSLSYAELNARSNQLAHYLRKCGVGAETRVGVCLERSIAMVVATLGILKAGGSYVPLDVKYPAERLVFMIEDAEVGLVVTETRLRDSLPADATQFVPAVCVDGDRKTIEEQSSDNGGWKAREDQLAYVMYTSGSTGRPKGVMVTHRNVVRLVRNTNYVEYRPSLVIGHVSNVVFDASTFEIWGALLNGCRLAVIPKFDVLAPAVFREQLKDLEVSTLFLTTALFQECVRSSPGIFGGMDQILFGGEVCDPECVRRGVEEEGPREVVHVYGPTETTTFASYAPLRRVEKGKAVPIGRAIGNTEIYLLDRELEAVGLGVPGEICIGGVGVARGYGNNPELTAERFVPDPFSEQGERLYRTGDLGRWREEGTIEFMGRRDEQVKIRGYRIELGEVEAALREQAGVKEAVVIAWVKPTGDKQLVGYVVAEKGLSVTAAGVRAGAGMKVPEYMVPMVVVLEELPLTANGKVDRRKLPGPEEVLEERGEEYVGPRNNTEAILAEVWAEALGLEQVGVEENFFELGGDSILCVRIIGRARNRGLEFSVQDLFEHQTVAALARVVRREKGEEAIVTAPFELAGEEVRSLLAKDVEDAYPLSRLQAGMLFHSSYTPDSGVYHDVISYRLRLPYEAEKLQGTVDRLTQRHEMLRTSIDMASFNEPMQLVHGRVDLRVVEKDWRLRSLDQQEAGLADFVERESRAGFAWEQAPLMRMFVHRLSEDAFQCSFSFHHAIMDGWSEASLIKELVQDYESWLAGRALDVRPLGVSYRDYIALERRAMASEESIAFWKEMLEGHAMTLVPLRGRREEERPVSLGEIPARVIAISEETQDQLRHLAREIGTPLKTVLLAAHMKALQVLSGQSDVTTGVVLNGRPEVEGGEQVVGLFLNTVPFRLRLESGSWKSFIRETFAAEQRILPHRRYPMVDLRAQFGGEEFFETSFNYVHFHVYNELGREGQEGRRVIASRGGYARTNFDFSVNFEVSTETGKLQGTVHCDTGMISAGALERVTGYYERLLAGMVEDRIGDARPEEERRQIEEWNRTEAEIPSGCVHELFEEQVRRRPDAVAVVQGRKELTYGELNRRANQLGHYLRGLGVGPDERVAICVERGLEMIIGLLGIWKAGGAYVPLDPAYPAERLRFMLEDSSPLVLLTQGHLQGGLPEMRETVAVVALTGSQAWQDQPETNLDRETIGLTTEHVAYVIYTSGSTGLPKGVMVGHRGVCNLALAQIQDLAVDEDARILQFSSSSFDASVFEILMALLRGSLLYLASPGRVLAGETLVKTIARNRITHATLPPAVLAGLSEQADLDSMRTLIVAGDAVTGALVKRWAPKRRFMNAYGPTEMTVWATIRECHAEEVGDPPIGRPIANTRVYILDAHHQAVPVGVKGELYIGGAGVARGYLKRQDLTAEKFVPEPFSEGGGRMYKTGDLGRWLEEGAIEFVGRSDFQVKIRGYRIELGEIEARLLEQEGVEEAVVVAREEAPGEKRLVAYYTGGATEQKVSVETLRMQLSAKLPEYMIPAAYVRLERLPLTANGKVDRKRLPAPEVDAFAVRGYEAPEGEIETIVAGIWGEVLKVERIGRHDDFFELGGHSLLAMQTTARLRQNLGVAVRMDALFARPVLSDFARAVEIAWPSTLPAVTRPEPGENPAATAAENIFLTGVFEFLGSFLPAELLKRTQATVYGLAPTSKIEEGLVKNPYYEEDVVYDNKTQGNKLAGTLTVPQGKGPFPAVVLITGSGPQDRDETIMGHKPFLVLADYLTRRGIAVLRADDRGVGKSSGEFSGTTTADFATDTEAGIAYLKTRREVNPKMIGLIGHSEGGIIAPMVAVRNPDVAFITILAGPGVPGDEVLDMRVLSLAEIAGKSRKDALKDGAKQRKVLEIVKENADDELMERQLREELGDEMSSAQIDSFIRQLNHRWLRFLITYDPAQALRKVTCPVLALNGDKDFLVPPKQNLPPIRAALEAAGNRNFEIVELPGLNHLFQTARTGAPSEYAEIEETMSPVVLEKIAGWILKIEAR